MLGRCVTLGDQLKGHNAEIPKFFSTTDRDRTPWALPRDRDTLSAPICTRIALPLRRRRHAERR